MAREKKEKTIAHPLEEVLNIESGTTVVEYTEALPVVSTIVPTYDEKDEEIEQKLDEIYSIAISQVATISDELELIDGRYKARVGEVAATMLNVALGSVREKRELKKHKDVLTKDLQSATTPNTVNNNLVLLRDRNEILRVLEEARK